jgi:hypothetical protein
MSTNVMDRQTIWQFYIAAYLRINLFFLIRDYLKSFIFTCSYSKHKVIRTESGASKSCYDVVVHVDRMGLRL